MSELQISLLLIGIAVVLVVYGYSWQQQRRYRRKFGAAFRTGHEDALYRLDAEKTVDELLAEPVAEVPDEEAEHALSPSAPVFVEMLRGQGTDGVCALLEPATDYIAVLTFDVPAGADSLTPLWQKRFDFGKSVHACGLNAATGAWEKVIPESHLFYAAFKLTLQLADRSGAVGEVRLSDFRDLARDIAAQLDGKAELPDVAAAAARAQELDGFCAEVDQMIGLNILPSGERTFSGDEVAAVAAQHGMALQADGAFHLADAHGHTVFSLGNYEDVPFQHHTIGQMWVNGLTLLLDVPRVEQPTQRFDEMAVLARQLAMDLRAAVVDDHRVALGEPGFAQIREQIAAIENRMLFGKVVPGSAQARRLFS
jgi:FtsZ-interacting cell division protein ZipA